MDSRKIANVEQAAEWDGPAGENRVRFADVLEAKPSGHSERLWAALGVEAADRVLDVGCGTGAMTRRAARAAVDGSVLGVDLSRRMLELARHKAAEEGLANVTFEQADAQVHPFSPHCFDIAMSRFGTMFFADPVAAFGNIGRALRPTARLVMAVWQGRDKQEWAATLGRTLAAGQPLPDRADGPSSLGDPAVVEKILTAAGFAEVGFEDVDEPLYYGPDVDTAVEIATGLRTARELLAGLDEAETARRLEGLRAAITAHDTGDGIWFDSRAWIVSARVSAARAAGW